jgi:glycosyltransferase involved in cell wall biosynthesis
MEPKQLFFSIVIPTYNRPERLQTCLKSLTGLNYPRDRFEVVVIDDGSAEPLDAVVAPFKEVLNLQFLRQTNAGPASARNLGAANAKGEFLVFTDDDCQPAPNWLQAMESHFNQHPDSLLGGHTVNELSGNIYSEASQLLVDYLYEYYNRDPDKAAFFTSNNFALSRKRFCEIGYFDTTFPLAAGEDRELCDRWLQYNYPMLYVPDALVYHAHKLSLKRFWRQHFNYGRGAFHFHQVRAKRNSQPMKVEPLSFYTDLLRYPFSAAGNHPGILLAGLFFLSQVANVVGFFWERSQRQQLQKT